MNIKDSILSQKWKEITPKTPSRAECKNYVYSRREAEMCKNVNQIEAYAYAQMVKGFARTNLENFNDKDLNMLITFSSTFDSDDLPPCPWDGFSKCQYFDVHESFGSPWIARAADMLGFDHFRALALQAIDATRSHVEDANACDDSDPCGANNDYETEDFYTEDDGECEEETQDHSNDHDEDRNHAEAEYNFNHPDELEQRAIKDLVYKEMQKHYPHWLADESESVKITAAHARSQPVNNPRTSASFVPHRQTGGSNGDGDSDGDGEPHRSFRLPTPPLHYSLNSLTHSLIFVGGAQ
jgi:hypothetical protein